MAVTIKDPAASAKASKNQQPPAAPVVPPVAPLEHEGDDEHVAGEEQIGPHAEELPPSEDSDSARDDGQPVGLTKVAPKQRKNFLKGQ